MFNNLLITIIYTVKEMALTIFIDSQHLNE